MSEDRVVRLFSDGKVVFPDKYVDASKTPWTAHQAYSGVYLKDLVTAKDTNGTFSCHVIWINKGFSVGDHSHGSQWEFNEALQGHGRMVIQGKEYACDPGSSFVTSPGVSHEVSAPAEDIYFLAKFVPALK